MLIKDIKRPKDYDNYLIKKKNSLTSFNIDNSVDSLLNPKTLSQKLSWYNCYCKANRELFFKTTAKQEVAKILGTDKYCIPTYQICEDINDIQWDNLIGKKIVIKPDNSASSKGIIISKRKVKKKDIPMLMEKVKENYYIQKDKKIIIEEFIGKSRSNSCFQTDYKLWCFFGKVALVEVINGRSNKNTSICYSTFFNSNFEKIDLKRSNYKQYKKRIEKPKNFEEMITTAEKISANIPVIRVDLYNIDGKIYFGECTTLYQYHCRFNDNKDKELSYLLDLRKIPEKIIKRDCLNYEIATSYLSKEAKEILNCNDEDFEFCNSINNVKVPLYFSNKDRMTFIYYLNNVWNKIGVKRSVEKEVYNKKYKKFVKLLDKEVKEILKCKIVNYGYDIEGDIVYFDKNNPYVCLKYNDGNFEKTEYEIIRKQVGNIQTYNKEKKKFE